MDSNTSKDHLRLYRNISSLDASVNLPMELQVLLTVPELTPYQILAYCPPGKPEQSIEPPGGFGQVRHIVLERWSCRFLSHSPSSSTSALNEVDSVSPALMYKSSVSTFRSLYSLSCARFLLRMSVIAFGMWVEVDSEYPCVHRATLMVMS